MRTKLVAPVVSLAVVLGACGGGTANTSGDTRSPSSARWSEADVLRLTGMRRNSDFTYRLAAHPDCVTPNLLRSTEEVKTYKAAGDVITTNPDRSVGVKVNGESASCRRLFAQALARVR
jgi:hypothetical protein